MAFKNGVAIMSRDLLYKILLLLLLLLYAVPLQ